MWSMFRSNPNVMNFMYHCFSLKALPQFLLCFFSYHTIHTLPAQLSEAIWGSVQPKDTEGRDRTDDLLLSGWAATSCLQTWIPENVCTTGSAALCGVGLSHMKKGAGDSRLQVHSQQQQCSGEGWRRGSSVLNTCWVFNWRKKQKTETPKTQRTDWTCCGTGGRA